MNDELKSYGLIGKKLSHSFSPKYFEEKFDREDISDAQYLLFPLENILEFPALIRDYALSGLNVTIPYKQDILPFIDELSAEASEIQAVNCIAFDEGKLIGYNTDVIGFEQSLIPFLNEGHSIAMILGTGGAAHAVAFVLKKLEIPFRFVSRQKGQGFLSYEEAEGSLMDYSLIINTTPLGSFPNEDGCPLESFNGIGEGHLIYDLVYNPEKTALLKKAEAQGATIKNGLEMLEIQAEESWKIWQEVKS